jgi:hypothetical protein
VSIEMPKEKLSKKFYNSLSRDLLFNDDVEEPDFKSMRKAEPEEIVEQMEEPSKQDRLMAARMALMSKKGSHMEKQALAKALLAGGVGLGGTYGMLGAADLTGLPQALHKRMGGDGRKGAVGGMNSMLFQPWIDAKRFADVGQYGKSVANVGIGGLNIIPALVMAGLTARFAPGMLAGSLKGLGRTGMGKSLFKQWHPLTRRTVPGLFKGGGPNAAYNPAAAAQLITSQGGTRGAIGSSLYNLGRGVTRGSQHLYRGMEDAIMKGGTGIGNVLGSPFHAFGARTGNAMQSGIGKAFQLAGTIRDPVKLGIFQRGGTLSKIPGATMATTIGASLGVPWAVQPMVDKFSMAQHASNKMDKAQKQFNLEQGSPLLNYLAGFAKPDMSAGLYDSRHNPRYNFAPQFYNSRSFTGMGHNLGGQIFS